MPAERTTMRQVREILRLKFVGDVPLREIARRVGVAASTVRATVKRFVIIPLTHVRRCSILATLRGCRHVKRHANSKAW